MASHEFRTPLTTIQASVDLLHHYGDRMDDNKKERYLQEIAREVTNITDLLDGILTIGRAEAGHLDFRPVNLDLNLLCADLIEKSKLAANPEHVLVFDWQGGRGDVGLDEQLIRHIISNMLSNAVKYSPDDGLVRLEVIREEDEVRIEVKDVGIGIPEQGRERIFEAFHRFSNVGAISGAGLGMAILKTGGRAARRRSGL